MAKTTKVKAGIFSLTLLSMASLGITPSLSAIAQSFPDAGATTVQMLTSIPSLIGIVAALVIGKIANVTPKKSIAIVGVVLVAVGGLLPYFFSSNLAFMLVCSGILGLGVGAITNVTQLLFTEFLPPEERQAAMGLNTAFVSLGAMFMTMVGGFLAAGGWRNNYLVYLLAIVVLVLSLALIPNDRDMVEAAKQDMSDAPKGKISPSTIVVAVLGILFLALYNSLMNNMAMVAITSGLATPETVSTVAGLAGTLATLGGLACGLVLGKLLPHFMKQSFLVAFGLVGVGLILVSLATSLPVYYVACFLVGATLSIFMSQAPFVLSVSNPPYMIAASIAVYSIGTCIGGFLSPIVLNAISGAVLDGTPAATLRVAGVIALVTAAILTATGFQKKVLDEAFAKQSAPMPASANE